MRLRLDQSLMVPARQGTEWGIPQFIQPGVDCLRAARRGTWAADEPQPEALARGAAGIGPMPLCGATRAVR